MISLFKGLQITEVILQEEVEQTPSITIMGSFIDSIPLRKSYM